MSVNFIKISQILQAKYNKKTIRLVIWLYI